MKQQTIYGFVQCNMPVIWIAWDKVLKCHDKQSIRWPGLEPMFAKQGLVRVSAASHICKQLRNLSERKTFISCCYVLAVYLSCGSSRIR